LRRTDDSLTGRELDVLTLITRGLTDKEIARELGIARPTVSNHVSNLLLKLGVERRVEAAVVAVTQHLVPPRG
jgi:DNA-binding NarL/FixJ family response regulator